MSNCIWSKDCSRPGFPVLHYLLEFAHTHVHWMDEAIQPSHHVLPLLLLLSVFSIIRVFSNEPTLHIRWPKYWSFTSESVLPMIIHGWFPLSLTGLISLQFRGLSRVFSNTTIQKLQCFGAQPSYMVQLSHPYVTTGKTIGLTIQTFVSKMMSLLFNMLSRIVIASLPRIF